MTVRNAVFRNVTVGVALARQTNPGAVCPHGRLLVAALRALQPAHHLVILHVAVAVLGQLLEHHEADVPAVATRCAEEQAPALESGRNRRYSRVDVSTEIAQRQCRLFAKYSDAAARSRYPDAPDASMYADF